ncbi:MAG TPA: lysozyme inhibitor LprI family protein [Sphingomicrobium sp.]
MFALAISLFAAGADPAAASNDCPGNTTIELNDCAAKQLEAAEARLQKYQQAAIDRYSSDDESDGAAVILGIKASSEAFAAYRSIECATVYEDYKEGTIRNLMSLGCKIQLTHQRTHTIWENWLQYMDSTPPILPEPKPTE